MAKTHSGLPSTSASSVNARQQRDDRRAERTNGSDDELFDELEDELDDAFMASFREKRLEQMRKEQEMIQALREDHNGKLSELTVEKEVIQATLKQKKVVVHFYHPDFRRCRIMDQHLEKIAAKHFATRFIKVDVANVPFLVVKLEIQVLPCLIVFIDGITKDKIVGFDTVGEGSGDNFSTAQLELRLSQAGVINPGKQDGAIRRPNLP